MRLDSVAHQIEIDRLERAMLNHHILIHAIRQLNETNQMEIDYIKVESELVMEKIVDFVKINYIPSSGFQGLLERGGFKYITCSVKPDCCYKKFADDVLLSEFLMQSKENGADFFDFSFPEDFLDE